MSRLPPGTRSNDEEALLESMGLPLRLVAPVLGILYGCCEACLRWLADGPPLPPDGSGTRWLWFARVPIALFFVYTATRWCGISEEFVINARDRTYRWCSRRFLGTIQAQGSWKEFERLYLGWVAAEDDFGWYSLEMRWENGERLTLKSWSDRSDNLAQRDFANRLGEKLGLLVEDHLEPPAWPAGVDRTDPSNLVIRRQHTGEVLYRTAAETLRGADLATMVLIRAALRGADLRGADLEGADLRGADLEGADLRGAKLVRAGLGSANLCDSQLAGTDLSRSDFRGARLDRANLRGADLALADARSANLYRADLSRANLSGANLDGANLTEADLSGAILAGANVRTTRLTGAILDGVLYDRKTRWPLWFDPRRRGGVHVSMEVSPAFTPEGRGSEPNPSHGDAGAHG